MLGSPIKSDEVPASRRLGPAKVDATLDCIRLVYGKPSIWDISVSFWTEPVLPRCPDSKSALDDALATDGIRVMEAQDFVFIIASKLFQPQDPMDGPHALLKWSTIRIHFNVQALREGEEMPENARDVATELLRRARMIPFNMSMMATDGFPKPGSVDADLSVAVWEGKLGPGEAESVVSVINGRPHFSTARLVYGEMGNGKYVMLWDSPLFNVLHGDIYFQDVNADGNKEIIIESTTYGNHEYPILVIFDKNGREITRQRKCDTSSGTGENFHQEDGTCAIFGEDITFSENEEGPKEIYVRILGRWQEPRLQTKQGRFLCSRPSHSWPVSS